MNELVSMDGLCSKYDIMMSCCSLFGVITSLVGNQIVWLQHLPIEMFMQRFAHVRHCMALALERSMLIDFAEALCAMMNALQSVCVDHETDWLLMFPFGFEHWWTTHVYSLEDSERTIHILRGTVRMSASLDKSTLQQRNGYHYVQHFGLIDLSQEECLMAIISNVSRAARYAWSFGQLIMLTLRIHHLITTAITQFG